MEISNGAPFDPTELSRFRLPAVLKEEKFNVCVSGKTPVEKAINRLEWAWYEGMGDELIAEIPYVCWEVFLATKALISEEICLVQSTRGLLLTYSKYDSAIEHAIESRLLDSLRSSDRHEKPFWGAITEVAVRFIALDLNSRPIDEEIVSRCQKLIATSACKERIGAIFGY